MSRRRTVRALVLGQVPPPLGGQSVMIAALVGSDLEGVEIRHVRMAYSKGILDNRRVQLRKITHLGSVIARSWWEMARFRPDLVYYPPGGANRVPMIRDVVTLLALRPFSRRLVLHFHAGGVSEVWSRGIRWRALAAVYRHAYFGADAAIQLSPLNPPDGEVLEARRVVYIPNGVVDAAGGRSATATSVADTGPASGSASEAVPRVLFVGAVIEQKGIVDLVAACRELWAKGTEFELDIVGAATPEMSARLSQLSAPYAERIRLHGVLAGDAKWDVYETASVFCLPSFFEAEGAPLVVLEAMMFSLPVVATTWRSIPDLVVDEETGLLVRPHDRQEIAGALHTLLTDRGKRVEMARAGRRRFESRFSLDSHLAAIRDLLVEVGSA